MIKKVKKIIKIVRDTNKAIKEFEPSEDTTLDADALKTIKAVAYEEISAVARQMLKILNQEQAQQD